MGASANAVVDRVDAMPCNGEVVPLSGEFSRWMSRLLGYATLAGACGMIVKVVI